MGCINGNLPLVYTRDLKLELERDKSDLKKFIDKTTCVNRPCSLNC